jgi:hypothetical protein
MRWLDKDGFLAVPQWDDRKLTPAQKSADPVHNPRCPTLVHCLEGAGLGDHLPQPDAFVQHDLDVLLEHINREGPFLVRTDAALQFRGTTAAVAFTRCADATLAAAPQP